MNPSISQGIMLAQRAQAAPTAGIWSYASNGRCALGMTPSAPNYSNMFPSTQDFCWETWVFPIERFAFANNWMITAWGSGGNPGGPQASNFSLYFSIDNFGSLCGIKINAIGSFSTTITAVAEANIFNSRWHHVAMSRTGTTISAWFDGQLYAQIDDFSGDLTYANVGGDAYWIGGGPVTDRDGNYIDCMIARYRNTRYTIGNSVYTAGSYNITPPSLYNQIPAVTGTQWVWWPNNTTNAFFSPYDAPWIPDINNGGYQFISIAGDSSGPDICPVGMVTPDNYNTTPVPYGPIGSDDVGTWTNNGTVGSQPAITTTGPSPIIGTACADFTKTGTDVRISSTNSGLMYWGNSFFLTMWVYIPANITNECKTIIACAGGTDNFVLNIGRPGQGLDWLSVYYSNNTEVAYAPHIWARNAWNYITVTQPTVSGTVGTVSAWAGAYGDSYAVNLNLTNVFTPAFGNGSSVSIGCKAGSSVSCQMYINLIQQTNGSTNNGNMNVYSSSQATIPMQTWQYRKLLRGETFTFQGTNGATNIQPINVTGT